MDQWQERMTLKTCQKMTENATYRYNIEMGRNVPTASISHNHDDHVDEWQ